jgi:DNA-binding NtrC family response regulator
MGQPSVPFQAPIFAPSAPLAGVPSFAPTAPLAGVPPIQALPRVPSVSDTTTVAITTAGCAGREHEVARLEEAYRAAQNGTDRLVLVEGGRGVGKSRLLAELRGRVRLEGGVVLEGRCESGRAFGPFAEIVDRALRFLEEIGVAPQADLAGLTCRAGCHRLWHQHGGSQDQPEASASRARHHWAGSASPSTSAERSIEAGGDASGALPEIAAFEKRMRFFDAVSALLRDVARVRPPVLLLHHLERADRGTIDLVHFLLEGSIGLSHGHAHGASFHTADLGVNALVVASVRDDVEATHPEALDALRRHGAARTLAVGALDRAGVRAYLQSEEAIARIIARTGGNPELIDLLLEADPLTPEARVERRLGRLSPQARSLVSALSVFGRPAGIDTLASITGLPLEVASRADLAPSDLLVRSLVDGQIFHAFERETDRQACYALLAPSLRHEVHARAVDACAQRLELEEAVRHAIATGDFARASDLGIAAAASLAARHAHAEAATLLEKLLSATDGNVPLVIRDELADLYRVAGNYRAALTHARFVESQRTEDPAAAHQVGYLLILVGDLASAEAPLTRARELAQAAGRSVAVAEAEAQLAELHYQRGAYTRSREWAAQALARAEGESALRIELHARNTLGKLALAQKDSAAAALLFEENRKKSAHAGLGHQEAQAHTNLGVAMLLRRDLPAAEQACKRAIEVATRASDTRDRAIATENLAVLAHLARDYRRALSYYHVAVALLRRLGNRAMLARVATNLGELYLSLGDRQRARAYCDLAAHVSGTGTAAPVTGERLTLRGRVDVADGRPEQARAAFESALEIFQRLGNARTVDVHLEIARLSLDDGDVSGARNILDALTPDDSPKRAAEVALVMARVDRAAGKDALASCRRAVDLAERAADDEALLPALVLYARCLSDVGESGAAARIAERAQLVDASLAKNVPEDAAAAWAERPVRGELMSLVARLSAVWTNRESLTPPRPLLRSALPVGSITGVARVGADARFEKWSRRYPAIVGNSAAIASVLGVLDKVSASDAIVLVRGESGTGKELVAEAVHHNSPRAQRPIVKVNCAALVETLLLSELFGHERGAFTGAQARKKGRFELADGGTIFLDEIGDISPATQVALLRVLQEREFERVGGTAPIRVDVRIVVATHRDLEKMVREGTFREDLYYRLRGVTVEMPPLRKRIEDLPILCERLLARIALERNEAPKTISRAAIDLLRGHRWPGNVRELENVLRSATLFAEGDELLPDDLAAFAESFSPREEVTADHPAQAAVAGSAAEGQPIETLVYEQVRQGATSLFDMKKRLERECIVRALVESNGNITRAATLLGMKRPRLSQLVKEYELGELGK